MSAPRRRLTLDQARHMDYDALVAATYGLIQPYEVPEMETEAERLGRINRTLDELPDVYAWIYQLHAYFDHWADFYYSQHGSKSLDYKQMREKRDAMENAAKAAKLRYEGTSRVVTLLMGSDEQSAMPRHRQAVT